VSLAQQALTAPGSETSDREEVEELEGWESMVVVEHHVMLLPQVGKVPIILEIHLSMDPQGFHLPIPVVIHKVFARVVPLEQRPRQ
jgi:hypothetical protein